MAWPGAAGPWARLVAEVPEGLLVVGVPIALHLLVFWGMAALYGAVDRSGKPGWVARHRIQQGPPRQPPLSRVLPVLAWNQLFFSPLLMAGVWVALWLRGWVPQAALPSPGRLLLEVAGLSAFSLVCFYASHRALHHPWWMKRVHRVHHEYRTSSALASEYAHPFEFVVANFGTLAVGVVLLAPSLPALYLFTVLSLHTVVAHHSGYALPGLPWSVPHDWHHYRFTESFGTIGLLDRLFGTDRELRSLKDGDER